MANKIRLAMVMPFYLPVDLSGSDRVGCWLAENLAKGGFECVVFTSDRLTTRGWYLPFGKKLPRKPGRIRGVEVHRLPCGWWYSLFCLLVVRFLPFLPSRWLDWARLGLSGPNLLGLDKELEEGGFDVVWVMPFPTYLNSLVVEAVRGMRKRLKLVMTPFFHEETEGYENELLGGLLRQAKLVQVLTRVEGRALQRLFDIDSSRLVEGGVPFPLGSLREVEELAGEVTAFRKEHGLEGKKLILFAGNKIKEKGLGVLVEAVGSLCQQSNRYCLVVMGKDTVWWSRLRQQWEDKGFVLDLGYVTEEKKEVVFAAADVFCMPSRCESLGIVYLEAWQKKKPVIGARVSAVEELFGKSGGGELVEFGDKMALERALLRLLKDGKRRRRLGRNGYDFVRGNLRKSYVQTDDLIRRLREIV